MALRNATRGFRSAAPARVELIAAPRPFAPAAAALGGVPKERRAPRVTATWHDRTLRTRVPGIPELRHEFELTLREAARQGGQP